MRLAQGLDQMLGPQRGALMPWVPVFLGLGVGLYFALPVEPRGVDAVLMAGLALVLAALSHWRRADLGPPVMAVALVLAGLCLPAMRTGWVAAPVLDFRYYGPIEGRVVLIDRSASDKIRLTLDQVQLPGLAPEEMPGRVRISLHGQAELGTPMAGERVATTGHLSPPEGPGEPRGFDFQRHAWFQGIGGVGYTRNPVLRLAPNQPGAMPVATLRARFSALVQARISGPEGGFATAILTGDRSAIPLEVTENLRHSNIAHLLAISGLHMGLLTGFVFLVLRSALSLIPALALRWPSKKLAAIGALLAGAFYLALSGGNVATERAFIQVAVMFCAVLIDRRAITLRSVAIAAVIVLLHRPESLLGPGFQMSFAATTALVFVFSGLRANTWMRAWPRPVQGAMALVLSSVVAGLATAPFAAAHFNIWAAYGLIANLLTVPVMGSLVIPAAVVALLLMPFGLDWIAFAVMEQGLSWILWVASWVSSLPQAVRPIPVPGAWVLTLVSLGALFAILWQGRARWVGAVPVLLALLFWTGGGRPDILISSTGRLVGVMEADGRGLSRARGDGFVARLWLENDGDRSDQMTAAGRPVWSEDGAGRLVHLGDITLWHGVGRRAEVDLARACANFDWVISPETPPVSLPATALLANLSSPSPGSGGPLAAHAAPAGADCLFLSERDLETTGAIAIHLTTQGPQIETARQWQGQRPWVR